MKIQSVENLQTKYHVEVKLEKKIGRIQIKGIPEYVHDAADELHKILRESKRARHTRQKADLRRFAGFIKSITISLIIGI